MTTMIKAKAFRVTDASREILQNFIVEPIPEGTKYVLASSEGYLFFDEEPAPHNAGVIRMPKFAMLSSYDIEYESE